MDRTIAELAFDGLLALAVGFAVVSYMLGVLLDPVPAIAVGVALVVGGVLAFVPRDARAPAMGIGIVTVGVAGGAVPRAVETLDGGSLPIGDELAVTLAASGFVLLLAIALVRLTAFDRRGDPAT